MENNYNFETLKVTVPDKYIYWVEINRPAKRNAMNTAFWAELPKCFDQLAEESNCRVIVLSGAGKGFTAGIDLNTLMEISYTDVPDPGRRAFYLRKAVLTLQDSFTAIERCPKPVICAIHGFCIGGGIDLATACDIRYCTADSYFQIKEVDVGLQADVGTLQRFPKVTGNDSVTRELVYTGRRFEAQEAERIGLIGRVLSDQETLMNAAFQLARLIASKSPIAVQGSKVNMNYSRDHTVEEGLHFAANWNMSMLQSEDVVQCAMAALEKSGKPIQFSKL